MNAKDLITYDHAQRQVVEHISKVVPDVGAAVFASAFGIEAIRLCDASRFVVSADEVDAPRPAQFQADQE